MTNTQRRVLLNLATKYRVACKWDQEKAITAAIRALEQWEKKKELNKARIISQMSAIK